MDTDINSRLKVSLGKNGQPKTAYRSLCHKTTRNAWITSAVVWVSLMKLSITIGTELFSKVLENLVGEQSPYPRILGLRWMGRLSSTELMMTGSVVLVVEGGGQAKEERWERKFLQFYLDILRGCLL